MSIFCFCAFARVGRFEHHALATSDLTAPVEAKILRSDGMADGMRLGVVFELNNFPFLQL